MARLAAARIILWIAAGVGGLILAAIVVVLVAGGMWSARTSPRTPAGLPAKSAIYIPMSDGTRIAADVWLPRSLKAGQNVPVLLKGTPYWRGAQPTFLGGALAELGLLHPPIEPDIPLLLSRGYAVISFDTRGTGASFGHLPLPMGAREVADVGEIADWAARQPWANGKVGAYGFSYRGMLADRLAGLARPEVKAIAPSFDFTDPYLITHPGGILNVYFTRAWGAQTAELNRGELPSCGWICRLVIEGPERVDADRSGKLLKAAIAEHQKDYDMWSCSLAAPARDEPLCAKGGASTSEISALAHRRAIERAATPMEIEVGWFDDGSPGQALRRFSTWSNPQILIVGPISHGGFMSTDPYRRPGGAPDPSYRAQVEEMADFFDAHLKRDDPAAPKQVSYFVLGQGAWRTSPSWPPPGVEARAWYFMAGHALGTTRPAAPGADQYPVDFSATSGVFARFRSPVDLSATRYSDRAFQDRKLAVYESSPLSEPVTIAGDLVAHLSLASNRSEGEVIIYLEDVLPDGRVVYLSEGVLNLALRKRAGEAESATSADPLHGYRREDLQPMPNGSPQKIDIALSPIAARFVAGHR
ncbi:MAG: CocE/NonD family hydrolase, partial [Caulobacteraceae bacterium]